MAADPVVVSMLSALVSTDSRSVWCEFLERYSGLLYHVVHSFDRDPDRSGNCFLFVCEQLSANRFRRLRKFDVAARASFSTWLCAVTHNLCLDWYRKEHGRFRVFASISQRGPVDQLLFELAFRRGLSIEQAREELMIRGIELSFVEVEKRIVDLRRCMTSRQLWLLSSRNRVPDSVDSVEEGAHVPELTDPAPNPEAMAVLRQTHEQVSRALAALNEADRLLIRLRYLEGLTLHQVANLVGLKDAQTADRRLREVIEQLRQTLGITDLVRGKARAASV